MIWSRRRKIAAGAAAVVVLGGIAAALSVRARRPRPVTRPPVVLVKDIVGAVIQQDPDPRGQSPIADVEIGLAQGQTTGTARTDFSGFFKLALNPAVEQGQPITLRFTHADYEPLTVRAPAGDQLLIVHMLSLHPTQEATVVRP